MNKHVVLLINELTDDSYRIARSGNPLGNYGQTEICMKCTRTKKEMMDHLKKMERGGYRITHLVRELNEITL